MLALYLGDLHPNGPYLNAETKRAEDSKIRLCQVLRMGPSAYTNRGNHPRGGLRRNCAWENARLGVWQAYAQGEYVAHPRTAHVAEYRLRVDDELDIKYLLTHEETSTPYKLNVGDKIQIQSYADPMLNRDLTIQPDGTITLLLVNQVRATGRTVAQLQDDLLKRYLENHYKEEYFDLSVLPLETNSRLKALRDVVDNRAGVGGQSQVAKITPEGTIALPMIGSVMAQGLTLSELQQELDERYRENEIEGVGVIPSLVNKAPRYIYVLGEVNQSGRFELVGPTTVMQAIAMAGNYKVGANLRQVVIFRRGDDWRLMATKVNIEGALQGRQACPAGEISLSDSDVIIVPKSKIQRADEFIEMIFTKGLYRVFPIGPTLNFSKLSAL